jgi:hypothetical protein
MYVGISAIRVLIRSKPINSLKLQNSIKNIFQGYKNSEKKSTYILDAVL